jgi:hypothetical protein
LYTRRHTLTASIAAIIMFGLLPNAAFGASAKSTCSKPKSVSSGNNWRTECKVVFSNGPRVKIRYTQKGSTLEVRACAYGHKPAGFKTLFLTSQLEETGNAQAGDVRLRSGSSCSLSGREPVALWGSLKSGMKVSADATLVWKKQDLTGHTGYSAA